MASKLQFISQLAEHTLKAVTTNGGEWKKYLNSTAFLYRYPFNEQLLIYAQRPDATACASFDFWSIKMQRRINKGAKGIALIEDNCGRLRLKYVFDVSDTNAGAGIPMPYIWEMKDDYQPQIREVLTNAFGETEDAADFKGFIRNIVDNAVQDNSIDYLEDFMRSRDGSLLEELDELNAGKYFNDLLTGSVAYSVLSRMRIEPHDIFPDEDFAHIYEFNTFETATILGNAVSRISEMILLTVSKEIRSIEKQGIFELKGKFANNSVLADNNTEEGMKHERGGEHGNAIQNSGRVSDSGLGTGGNAGSNRQIRDVTQDIPDGTQKRDIPEPVTLKQADSAFIGDRSGSEGAGEIHHGRDDENRNDPGQSNRSNGMGTAHEQHQGTGRGNRDEGADLQLTFFPTEHEQFNLISEAEETEKSKPSALSISQEDIDRVLALGSGFENGKYRIYAYFSEHHSNNENAIFLRKEYGIGGRSHTYSDGTGGHVNHNDKGLKLDSNISSNSHQMTWNKAAQRIGELIAASRYLNSREMAYLPEYERQKAEPKTDEMPQQPATPNNFRITDDNLGHGGTKTKYGYNVAAIKLLKLLENENRLATPEEQETLSKYVGWGGLPQVFDSDNASWAAEYRELNMLLSSEEYASARGSTLNAHYTSPTVIKAMYKAIENMGFKSGNILEPACGVGNFFGIIPDSLINSKLYGIEIDSITGRIAKQLYQKSNITVQGYEDTALPDSFFDLAIGNVPFGSYGVVDKKYNKHKFLIHDYFFAKTLDKVRPGGIVAFVTSKGTLDKKNPEVRKYIAQRAELLGAIRLPNNTFLSNAGTQVTTDVIFLQKRDRLIDVLPEWVHLGKTEDGIPINAYFAENPKMMLGTMTHDERMYGNANVTTCAPFPGSNLSEQLDEAIQNIRANITEYEIDEPEETIDSSIPADPDVRNFSFTLVDGKLFFRENSRMNRVVVSETAENRIKGMLEIRDCVRTLIEYQTEEYADQTIESEQARLNVIYDCYTKKYGLINSRGNDMAFSDDSSYPLLCSLEVLNEDGELERKADMFTKRTIKKRSVITHVDTSVEALGVSIGERASVDLHFMQALTGFSEEKVLHDLDGVVFRNPKGWDGKPETNLESADEYLSGNVREKLAIAKQAADDKPEVFAVNVKTLETAQPKDLSASEIDVRLGAIWIPPEDIRSFMFELLGTSGYLKDNINVHYSKITGNWNVQGKSVDRSNVKSNVSYGTKRIGAYSIIEETLNLRDVRIFDTVLDDEGREKRVLNKAETAIAQQKQEVIKEGFKSWIWKDPQRRDRLTTLYNERFNSTRPREYDGSHIKFTGMNPEIALEKHQIDAVARVLYGGNTLLAHCVGAGKTFEMTAAAMEGKHLGLCNKSMMVVPSHLTEQWGAEFLQLYPSANILVATKKDFEPKNRRKFCARIATGDYDAVIIGHSQFEKIPISFERQVRIIEEQINDITGGISEAKKQQLENFQIKQLERTKKMLEVKLRRLNDTSRKDDVVTFEELGIDRIFIDEADEFKNLFLYTKMRNVAGISQTDAQKSSDMFAKCRYMDELTGGKGIIFSTGTPISNSITELYTMQRYLQYDELHRRGLGHFDAWASTFGETVTAIELAPEGTGYRAKTRFAKFYNLPELMNMFAEVADIKTADMLNLPVPKANFHNVSTKPSEFQKEMVADLAERANTVRKREVAPNVDNMLKITNDGRKLALDQRCIDTLLDDHEDSKVNACANNVFRHWQNGIDKKLTQLVFCDLSTPKNDGSFSVYSDIRQKLLNKGIPGDEMEFIHNANTDTRKKELFARVRKGQVRVLFGSTFKMGAGTNVQRLLKAIHDLDCPWRPRDLEQRSGRIVRQGNINSEVDIYRYVTLNTFDAYLYQILENKQKFIGQVITGKSPVRSVDDIDEAALSYAEVKALATGNPHIKEKMDLDIEVSRLKLLKASHESQIYALEDRILKYYPKQIKFVEERIAAYKNDIAIYLKHKPKPIVDNENIFAGMTVKGIFYAEKADAGKAILEACKDFSSVNMEKTNEYMGFPMTFTYESLNKTYMIILQGDLAHSVTLGDDIYGNITRINNELEGMTKKLEYCSIQLAELHTQMGTAQQEITIPFEKESELKEKSARLVELNILLNMDDKTPDSVDDTPPEQGGQQKKNRFSVCER